jgi:hypothetical protein
MFLRLTDEAPNDDFGAGGLSEFSEPLDVRIIVFPAAVENSAAVPLDTETAEWIERDRPTPYGGRPIQWGHTTCRHIERTRTSEVVSG